MPSFWTRDFHTGHVVYREQSPTKGIPSSEQIAASGDIGEIEAGGGGKKTVRPVRQHMMQA